MSLKRDNWTNDEVIKIVEGEMVPDVHKFASEKTRDYAQAYNDGIRSVVNRFKGSFVVPESSFSALSLDTESGLLVHTGTMPPQ